MKVMNESLQKEAYIQSLKNGCTKKEAAEACKACTTTIWNWVQKDKKFKSDIEEALDARIAVVEDALYNLATGKDAGVNKEGKKIIAKGQVIAQIFWLKNKSHGKYRDKQEVEFTVPKVVKQNTFVQAGEEPVIKEEEVEVEVKVSLTKVGTPNKDKQD